MAEALEKSHISGPGVSDIRIELLDKRFAEFAFYNGAPTKYPNFFDAAEELGRIQFKGRRMLWQDSCSRILNTIPAGSDSEPLIHYDRHQPQKNKSHRPYRISLRRRAD